MNKAYLKELLVQADVAINANGTIKKADLGKLLNYIKADESTANHSLFIASTNRSSLRL